MSVPLKKLSLEERLSLAAKKGKKRSKKPNYSPPSVPFPASEVSKVDQKSFQTDHDTQEELADIESEKDEVKKVDEGNSTVSNCETGSTRNGVDDDEDNYLSSIENSAPWSFWLPANFRTYDSKQLLKILEPHVLELWKQIDQLKREKDPPIKHDRLDSSLVKVIKEKEEIIEQLRREGGNLAKTELKQSNQIKALKKSLSELEEDTVILQEELSRKLEAYEDLFSTHKTLQKQLETSEAQVQKLMQENNDVATLNLQLSEMNIQVQDLRSELEAKETTIQNGEKNFRKEIELVKSAANEQVTLLETNLEKLRIELEHSSRDTSRQTTNLAPDLQQQCGALRKELESNKTNWSTIESAMNSKLVNLETQLEECKILNTRCNANLIDSRKLNDQLEAKLMKSEKEKQITDMKIKQMQLDMDSLVTSLKEVTEDYKLLQKKYDIQRSHMERNIDSQTNVGDLSTVSVTFPPKSEDRSLSMTNLEEEWMLPPEVSSISHFETSMDLKDGLTPIDDDSIIKSDTEKDELSLDINDIPEEAAALKSVNQENSLTHQNSGSMNYHRYSTEVPVSNQMNARMVSKLGAEIRRFEVEVSSLQALCDRIQKEKNAANDEVLRLLEENEKVQKLNDEKADLLKQMEGLKAQLDAALQLLGEKTELVEELENDVSDLKEMMHQQIQDMMEMQEKMR